MKYLNHQDDTLLYVDIILGLLLRFIICENTDIRVLFEHDFQCFVLGNAIMITLLSIITYS